MLDNRTVSSISDNKDFLTSRPVGNHRFQQHSLSNQNLLKNKPSYIFTIQEYNVIFLFNWLVKFIFSFLTNYHIYKPNLSLLFSTQTLTTFTRSVSVALFVFSSFLQAVLKQRPPRCSFRARRCSLVCRFSASRIFSRISRS